MSDEQKIFKITVREYCQKNVEPRAGEIDEGGGISDDMIKGLADIGVFGCTIPEEYEGSAQPGGSKYVVRGGSKKVVIDITSG